MKDFDVKAVLKNRRLVALVVALVIGGFASMGYKLPVDEICAVYGEEEHVLVGEIVNEVLNPSAEVTVEPEVTELPEPTPTP